MLLKAGADPNAKSKKGRTPLHDAAFNALSDMVTVLLRAGADVHSQDNEGDTPLHAVVDLWQDFKCQLRANICKVGRRREGWGVCESLTAWWEGWNCEAWDREGGSIRGYGAVFSRQGACCSLGECASHVRCVCRSLWRRGRWLLPATNVGTPPCPWQYSATLYRWSSCWRRRGRRPAGARLDYEQCRMYNKDEAVKGAGRCMLVEDVH